MATTEAFEARGTWPLLPGVPGGVGSAVTVSLTAIDGGDQVVVHLTVGPVLPLSSVVGQGFSCPAIADLSRSAVVGVAYALYVASSRPAPVRLDLDPGRLRGDLALPVASNVRDGSCEVGQPTARTAELSHDAKTQGAAWVLIPDAVDRDGTVNQSVAGYALRPKLGVGASVDQPVSASQTNGYALPVVEGCPSATACIAFSAS